MSNPSEPSDASKPVVKDKNPHNYRKVGYSMIVISVSLVLIGLLVWAIGDNYHFSSDIMANQEIDAMTPKHGFNLVYYDTAQPVGAKLKLLDSASTIDNAQQKQIQYAQQTPSPLGKVLIFNETLAANKQLVYETIAAIVQYQSDLAKQQSAKAQAAEPSTVVAPSNTTAPVSFPKQNVTSVTPINPTTSITTAVVPKQNVTSTMIPVNSTVSSTTNTIKSVLPTNNSTEKILINSSLTVKTNSTNTGNASSIKTSTTNSTSGHSKSASVSENMAVITK